MEEMSQKELAKLITDAIELLRLVIAEWDSDPMSVQCFDLRIVERAKQVSNRIKEYEKAQWKP